MHENKNKQIMYNALLTLLRYNTFSCFTWAGSGIHTSDYIVHFVIVKVIFH